VSTLRLGVGIGGPVTDFALLDEARGKLAMLELPSTPGRPSASVFEELRRRHRRDPGAPDVRRVRPGRGLPGVVMR